LTEARDEGLDAGGDASLRGDGPCLDRDGPLTLARGPRFGALSDAAGPQLASPPRTIRLRDIARHSRDERMSPDLSGDAAMGDWEQSARGSLTEGLDTGPRRTGRPDEEIMDA